MRNFTISLFSGLALLSTPAQAVPFDVATAVKVCGAIGLEECKQTLLDHASDADGFDLSSTGRTAGEVWLSGERGTATDNGDGTVDVFTQASRAALASLVLDSSRDYATDLLVGDYLGDSEPDLAIISADGAWVFENITYSGGSR